MKQVINATPWHGGPISKKITMRLSKKKAGAKIQITKMLPTNYTN